MQAGKSRLRATWMPSRALVMFAGRTALAAVLALVCSIALGLHEPHWAAWTVVSVGLPTRGDGLLKSLNRAIGTTVGAPVGVLLVFASHGKPELLVGLLALWLATCVYVGITSRNYRAYAAVLAGYSAAIVAMSLVGETGQLFDLGRDRCAGVFIGIAFALILLLLSRDVQCGQASRRIRRTIATAFDWSADRLAGMPRGEAGKGTAALRLRGQLSDILALDGAVHSATAESPAMWSRAGRLHGVVTVLLDLLVLSRSVERNFDAAAVRNDALSDKVATAAADASALLASAARTLRGESGDDNENLGILRKQAKLLRDTLASTHACSVIERRRIDLITELLRATEATLASHGALTGEPDLADTAPYPMPVYALDRSYAMAGALRAGFALLFAGLLWIATGWQGGPSFVAFTGIAVGLFAIRPDPRHTGIHFFASGALGAAAALMLYVTIEPYGPHAPHALSVSIAEGGVVFFAIVIAALLSNPFWASGFSVVFLVLSDPVSISHATASAVSAHALGVVAGCALAALAFHIVPTRGLERHWRRQRLKQVAGAISNLIASPVAKPAIESRHEWQSRSIDTLVRLALPAASEAEIGACMAWIEVGGELLRLRTSSLGKALSPSAKVTIDELLTALKELGPQSWHARLMAAETALLNQEPAGDQEVLKVRAVLAELIVLLERATGTRVKQLCREAGEPETITPTNAPSPAAQA